MSEDWNIEDLPQLELSDSMKAHFEYMDWLEDKIKKATMIPSKYFNENKNDE